MNRYRINSALNILTFIPLSFAVFGIFILGAIVAPVIFTNLTPRPLAAEIMTDIFQRYYPFAFICTSISLILEFIRSILLKKTYFSSKLLLLQLLMISVVTIMMGYSSMYILPRISEMRVENKGPTLWINQEFVTLHKMSENLAKGIFILGLIPLGIMISYKPLLKD